MNPEDVWRALEGHVDVLSQPFQQEAERIRSMACPQCGSGKQSARLNAAHPFSSNSVHPNQILTCADCKTEFDSRSGIILKINLVSG